MTFLKSIYWLLPVSRLNLLELHSKLFALVCISNLTVFVLLICKWLTWEDLVAFSNNCECYLTFLPLQAMHLVYRALEKESVPSQLPPSLIPPSKRKKTPVFPGAVPVLPASPPPKDSLRSTPSHGSGNSLNSTGSLSPKHSIKQAQVHVFLSYFFSFEYS